MILPAILQRKREEGMKELSYTPVLIAIDHGYGQMKTSHCVFSTGIQVCFGTPVFAAELLELLGFDG